METNPMHQFEVYRLGPEIVFGLVDLSFTNSSFFYVGKLNNNIVFAIPWHKKKITNTF